MFHTNDVLRLAPYSIVSTPDHDLHRQRRNTLSSFFSVASICRLEPIIKDHMAKMLLRMEQSGKSGEVLQMHYVFKACASDVIAMYSFDDSFHFMDEPDYGRSYSESTNVFFYLTHVFGMLPALADFAQNAPIWLLKIFIPNLRQLRDRQTVLFLLLVAGFGALTLSYSGGLKGFVRSRVHPIRNESRAPFSKAS